MKLEVELNYTDDGIEDAIVNRAAAKLLEMTRRGNDDRIDDLLRRVREEEVRKAVVPWVAEALEQPISRTNNYGEATGSTLTVREFIVETAKRELSLKRGRYSSDNSTLVKFIEEQMRAAIKDELKPAFDTAKAEVVRQLTEEGAKLLTTAIERAAR